MKIHFTKAEYKQLLDLAFIGHWVMTAHEAGGVKNPYDAIEQKIYSHAKAMGCEDYVDYDKASDWYYNTALLEEELMGFLDEYERQAFLNQF